MSYGRAPYFIWADGHGPDDTFTIVGHGRVPGNAIAQLVATMAWRDMVGSPDDEGLSAYIERGVALRGDGLKELADGVAVVPIALLAEALGTIQGLVDQQAMHDPFYEPVCDKLTKAIDRATHRS